MIPRGLRCVVFPRLYEVIYFITATWISSKEWSAQLRHLNEFPKFVIYADRFLSRKPHARFINEQPIKLLRLICYKNKPMMASSCLTTELKERLKTTPWSILAKSSIWTVHLSRSVPNSGSSKVMNAKIVLFFVLFQGMVSVILFAAEEDSKLCRSVFFTTRQDKRLKGHVVKRFESPSLTLCSHSCLRNSWCTSTNFKMTSEKNSKGTCELNKHGAIDENTRFHDQQGVTFSLLLKVISN